MKSDKPCISVIVTIYKVEKYLDDCITSIIEQTYENLEIILVDDGSPDNCPQICDSYAKADNRIRVIHKENGGLVSARKAGIKIATGEYIGYVDGDDWIDSNFYEQLYIDGIDKKLDIVGGQRVDEFKDGGSQKVFTKYEPGIYENENVSEIIENMIDSDNFFIVNVYGNLCLYVYRKECILEAQLKVDDEICWGEDTACFWSVIMNVKRIGITDKAIYHYRRRNDSLSGTGHKKTIYELDKLYRYMKNQLVNSEYEKQLYKGLTLFIFYSLLVCTYDSLLPEESEFLFPYKKVKRNSNIIIYGASRLGKEIVYWIEKRKFCNIVMWVDSNHSWYQDYEFPVKHPEEIINKKFDFVVIAVMNPLIAGQIQRYLLELGVPEDKIARIDQELLIEENIPFI